MTAKNHLRTVEKMMEALADTPGTPLMDGDSMSDEVSSPGNKGQSNEEKVDFVSTVPRSIRYIHTHYLHITYTLHTYNHYIQNHARWKEFTHLVKACVGCCGIVFGDLGTSPIYSFREAFASKVINFLSVRQIRRRKAVWRLIDACLILRGNLFFLRHLKRRRRMFWECFQ